MSALELALVLTAPAAMLVPHAVPLRRARPITGAAVWLLVLALRALVTIGLSLLALVALADVPVVQRAFAWCWHAILPDLPARFGFAEHAVAHAVAALPVLVVVFSVVWLGLRLIRAWLELHRQLVKAVGAGPLGSTVVADEHVLIAVTRLGRGRLVISDRALVELDADELAAGLAHEVAHLRRGHRPVLLLGGLLAALARPLPGTRSAERQLGFHLERDADAYVVRRLHDPLPLASAICKAAASSPPSATAALSGRGNVSLRLQELLGDAPGRSPGVERASRALIAGLVALTLAIAASAPAWALPAGDERPAAGHGCSHR